MAALIDRIGQTAQDQLHRTNGVVVAGNRHLTEVRITVGVQHGNQGDVELDIPLVSMLDTNCDPDLCEVPIPCNDDAVRSVQLILGRLADAINEGRHGSNDQRGGDSEG